MRARPTLPALLLVVAVACAGAGTATGSHSRGVPWSGTLAGGVALAAEGDHFFTWDDVKQRSPNRGWRRFGNARLVATLGRVLGAFAAANPDAPRIGIGDISRTHGGEFGRRYGGVGH